MSQNRSHAVMAQRAEPHDSLDFFPTPPWAARALCEQLVDLKSRRVWEPACGNGSMAQALAEYCEQVYVSDVHDYGGYGTVHDFLQPYLPDAIGRIDWIITNPPFRLAEQFITHAMKIAHVGIAMLVRTAFLESVGRYESLFSQTPPRTVGQFVERVPMVKGRLDRHASTATSYCWLVWERDLLNPKLGWPWHGTHFAWIAPCRARLERDKDYPA